MDASRAVPVVLLCITACADVAREPGVAVARIPPPGGFHGPPTIWSPVVLGPGHGGFRRFLRTRVVPVEVPEVPHFELGELYALSTGDDLPALWVGDEWRRVSAAESGPAVWLSPGGPETVGFLLEGLPADVGDGDGEVVLRNGHGRTLGIVCLPDGTRPEGRAFQLPEELFDPWEGETPGSTCTAFLQEWIDYLTDVEVQVGANTIALHDPVSLLQSIGLDR